MLSYLSSILRISIINIMRIEAKEQIKSLLAIRGVSITALAEKLTNYTGKKYTLASLLAKLKRGTLSYNEVLTICEILDYEIEFKSLV